jgi:hypothetical protein
MRLLANIIQIFNGLLYSEKLEIKRARALYEAVARRRLLLVLNRSDAVFVETVPDWLVSHVSGSAADFS